MLKMLYTEELPRVEQSGNATLVVIDTPYYEEEYEYDGYTFNIEVEADAVQTHNAVDALKSAWCVDVTVAGDGSISLQ